MIGWLYRGGREGKCFKAFSSDLHRSRHLVFWICIAQLCRIITKAGNQFLRGRLRICQRYVSLRLSANSRQRKIQSLNHFTAPTVKPETKRFTKKL
jgi:hypothetical protein